MKKFNYNEKYHNNVFNAKLSQVLDSKRCIMDFDFVLAKGNYTKILGDFKRYSDKASLATLRTYSEFAEDGHYVFIVKADINTKTGEFDYIYIKEVEKKSKVIEFNSWNTEDLTRYFKKHQFKLSNDKELNRFFSVETHEEFKQKLKNEYLF